MIVIILNVRVLTFSWLFSWMVRHSPGGGKPWCRYTNSYSHWSTAQVRRPTMGKEENKSSKRERRRHHLAGHWHNKKRGYWSSHLDRATGLISVWCLVEVTPTVCHQRTCSVVPPCIQPADAITQSLLSHFLEDERNLKVGSEGTPHPLRAPGDSYVSKPALSNALTVAEPEEFPHGPASAVVVGLATLLVQPRDEPKWQGSSTVRLLLWWGLTNILELAS